MGWGVITCGSAFFENGTVYVMSDYYNDLYATSVTCVKNSNQFNIKVTFKDGISIDKYKYALQATTNIFNWSIGQAASLTFPIVNLQASTTNSITWNVWQIIVSNGQTQITRNGINWLLPNLEV